MSLVCFDLRERNDGEEVEKMFFYDLGRDPILIFILQCICNGISNVFLLSVLDLA